MTSGISIFLIAAGAILRYAVTATVSGLSLSTVGLIVMLAGVFGLLIVLLRAAAWAPPSRREVVECRPPDPPGL